MPTALLLSTSLPPNGAPPKLFPTVSLPSNESSFPYRSFPPELSPSYFPRFPFRPPCRHSRIAPSHRSSPQAISHGLPPVHPLVTPVSLLPTGALPKLFPTASLPSTLSHRSSPQAISHGFPSVHPVHPVVIPVSLLPTRLSPSYFTWFPFRPPSCRFRIAPSHPALPKLFHMVSLPSTLLSLPYRSFPPELSPSYFTRFPFRPPCRHSSFRSFPPGLSPSYFPQFPFRPPDRHSRIAPSHRSSPQAISHGFPSVHPVVTPVISLLPTGAFHKLSHGFPSVHPVVTPVSLFPPELSPSYFPRFPFRPPCRHSRIAPSHRSSPHRSSPQAISHGFPSVHPVVTPVSLLPIVALPKLFHMVSLPSTLLSLPYRSFPPELSPCYFTRFPFRPPCRHSSIAPSHRSSPQAISHGFPSVHPVVTPVSLLPTGALPKLFHTVSFPSVHPVVTPVSLLPTGALPKLFHTVSLPSTLSSLPYRSFPPELSPSYFTRFPFCLPCRHSRIAPSHRSSPQAISHGFPSVHPVVTPVSLLPTGALPKLFPTVSLPSTLSSFQYRSFPPELSPSYFTRFPFRPPCRHSSIAPSHQSSPQAISHGFPSVHPVVIPVSLLPTGLSPSYFTRFPFRPPCRHSRIAPSHRSSPQAISHGFPSVHPVVTPVSLLPTGALPKLFHTVSLPSTLSSLPYRSFPPELSPSYFPRFPFRPPCRHSRIAPSHRSSPQAISHGFPSVHPVVIPVSLLPTGALPKLFHTVSLPSTLSSFQYRSFPPELSPSYFTRFPFRPPCRHSSIAPSHRSSPQAISHGFPSVHPVVIPVSLLPTGLSPSYFTRFPFRPTLSSLPYRSFPPELSPPELSPSYFTRFPFRPPCRHSSIAPSHRSSPQAISHGFPSVHPVVILTPELSPSYFTRFPFRPPCRHSRIAPSHRSSPHAISHGFLSVHPIVASIRSLPA